MFVQIIGPATLKRTDFVLVADAVLLRTLNNKALYVLINSHFNWDINFHALCFESQFNEYSD